jgi:ubiquinone/menaquinone biosynthesis C-methylase UbiE
VVQDRQSQQELRRLTIQDHLITASMGGVLPEQPDAANFRRVLDVGCATGGWVIEAAKTYPAMSLFGIDISSTMIEYARSRATEQHVADRVEFRAMDALRMLEFPVCFFDLVNLRFSLSWLRTWDWPKMLREMLRVTCPGGVVRLTESDIPQLSNSPMLTKWFEMALGAFFRAGHFFEQETTGLTVHLAPLLRRYGLQDVQTQSYTLEYWAGTPQGQAFCEDWTRGMKTHQVFLQKWGGASKDYDALCEQAVNEMQQSDFHATWPLLTAWGAKPG